MPNYLVREACSEQPPLLRNVRELTQLETLPGVDTCLRLKLLRRQRKARSPFADVIWRIPQLNTSPLRFSKTSTGCSTRLSGSAEDWDQAAQGSAVTYLMRWDSKRSIPLLRSMLPENDPTGAMWMFLLTAAHPPADGLRAEFRNGLARSAGRIRGTYAYMLAQIGSTEDRELIREQLARLQARAAREELEGDSMSEIDMIEAVNHGANWDRSAEEMTAVELSCVTDAWQKTFCAESGEPLIAQRSSVCTAPVAHTTTRAIGYG